MGLPRSLSVPPPPRRLDVFDGYDMPIKRADAVRYFYLYALGGAYIDTDFDGYGSSAITRTGCEQPGGYVAAADDCNDSDDAKKHDIKDKSGLSCEVACRLK